jgi:hypothetical protein
MTFYQELTSLINRHSKENGSNTPDFILARYLQDCLAAFDNASLARSNWYGHGEDGKVFDARDRDAA